MIGHLPISVNRTHNYEHEHHQQEGIFRRVLPGFLMPKAFQCFPHNDTFDSAGTSRVRVAYQRMKEFTLF